MSQNISLWGASYSNVPSVTLPKTGGGTASFTDVTDTTATASDVASGKYFYTAAGVKTQGTSTSGGYITQDANGYVVLSSTNGVPTLITKSITANGTYNASSDNASGYSNVSVNVSPNLTTKSITANGTYNASSDSADGYSSVTVNVQSSSAMSKSDSASIPYEGTLTFSNVSKSPSSFVVNWDRAVDSYSQISTSNNYITSISYDGTNTEGWYVSSASGGTVWLKRLSSGYVTWSYSSSQHTLTFTVSSSGTQQFNINNDSNKGYRLYYT